MTIDDLLRETAPDQGSLRAHTDGLRADVLHRATARRPRTARRSLRIGAAGLVASAVGLGGVAYATGDVPHLFTSIVDDFGSQNHVAASERPQLHQYVDLALPDGSRFAAWRGESKAMWCTTYVDNWDGVQPTGSGGGACGDPASARLNDASIAWAQSKPDATFYAVLFGLARPGEAEVRVSGTFTGTGERTELTVPVDPATSGYAVTLPGSNAHPWAYLRNSDGVRESELTLDFVDAAGEVVRTVAAPAA